MRIKYPVGFTTINVAVSFGGRSNSDNLHTLKQFVHCHQVFSSRLSKFIDSIIRDWLLALMEISPDLADHFYTIMVVTIGSPDDYRRWAFVHAIAVMKWRYYNIDSYLGNGAKFYSSPPRVECAKSEITATRERMVQRANTAMVQQSVPIQLPKTPETTLVSVKSSLDDAISSYMCTEQASRRT